MLGIRVTRSLPAVIDPEPPTMPPALAPRRDGTGPLTIGQAVTIPAVYRAVQVLATAAAQLSLDVERGGAQLDASKIPAIVRRPSVWMSRSDWIEAAVLSLACHGELFVRLVTAAGTLQSADVLPAHEVGVSRDKDGRPVYTHKGVTLRADEIRHLALMRLPGRLHGVGPIQAARESLAGVADMRHYLARWWRDSGQPAGVLTSDQPLTAAEAGHMRNAWNGLDRDGQPLDQAANPSGIKVLGKGLTYEPILLSPRDALWLEAQQFTTLEIARLFGIPASLMLTGIEGSSKTYANIEQEWIGFTRFTLIGYLRKLEELLTELTPHGQTVRFNLETLLRSDTAARYQAYQLALAGGWLTIPEVRDLENLPTLTAATPAPADKPAGAAA